MERLRQFGKTELVAVERAHVTAQKLICNFYVLAPRELQRMHYEVCTLERLAPEEICDRAFAQVLCYDRVKQVGATVIEHHDLYRICLQDHHILRVARHSEDMARDMAGIGKLPLEPLLLYVLTHELVHVVRFSQHMQFLDLAPELRRQEELSVEQATRKILAPVANPVLRRVINNFAGC